MAKHYTLIDTTGRPYMTATDRKALEAMLATGSVKASSARKCYAIRGANGELAKAISSLQANVNAAHFMPQERQQCAQMLDTIHNCENTGETCLVLLSWEKKDINPKNISKQLFYIKLCTNFSNAGT